MSSDKTKTVLVGDLKVGDTIRITQEVVIDDISDLNKHKPSLTKKLVLIKGTAASGGWRETKGEFIISKTEKVDLIKRVPPTTWYGKLLDKANAIFTMTMVLGGASLVTLIQ